LPPLMRCARLRQSGFRRPAGKPRSSGDRDGAEFDDVGKHLSRADRAPSDMPVCRPSRDGLLAFIPP
jgi:hypothetical protein